MIERGFSLPEILDILLYWHSQPPRIDFDPRLQILSERSPPLKRVNPDCLPLPEDLVLLRRAVARLELGSFCNCNGSGAFGIDGALGGFKPSTRVIGSRGNFVARLISDIPPVATPLTTLPKVPPPMIFLQNKTPTSAGSSCRGGRRVCDGPGLKLPVGIFIQNFGCLNVNLLRYRSVDKINHYPSREAFTH